jgi:hypothetical protein
MRLPIASALLLTLAGAPAAAQRLTLNFDALAAKAKDKTEVNLDAAMLQALRATTPGKPGADQAKVFPGVQEIHIRTYEFEKAGEYSDKDLDPLRKQVASSSGWSRIVFSKDQDETTEIHVLTQEGKQAGLLVIAAEPRELTVVYVLGQVQLTQLRELVQSTIQYDLGRVAASAP